MPNNFEELIKDYTMTLQEFRKEIDLLKAEREKTTALNRELGKLRTDLSSTLKSANKEREELGKEWEQWRETINCLKNTPIQSTPSKPQISKADSKKYSIKEAPKMKLSDDLYSFGDAAKLINQKVILPIEITKKQLMLWCASQELLSSIEEGKEFQSTKKGEELGFVKGKLTCSGGHKGSLTYSTPITSSRKEHPTFMIKKSGMTYLLSNLGSLIEYIKPTVTV